jgi:exoribonuclease II
MTTKFVHPDSLRLVNHGDNIAAAKRFIERIERETADVETLVAQGYTIHESWLCVKLQRVLPN